ncbi:hypothetical protein [Massilia orientalis]|jgi:hypothetical protein|uniref:Uncharacterized protein n=1 Tax=Massilia orientalis TaxID=3050128 RepID=A0ACC7MEU0_9BURK|nr:hypothetical protein [Massilia sp. YIM B02787]
MKGGAPGELLAARKDSTSLALVAVNVRLAVFHPLKPPLSMDSAPALTVVSPNPTFQ